MGTLRSPRAWLTIDGSPIPVIEASAHLNTLSSADTFSATLAFSALPAAHDLAWFCATTPITASIDFGTQADGSDRTTLVTGKLTQVDPDWATRTLRINGRDATGDLIEKKSNEKFQNQTAEQIVKTIGSRHGLTIQSDGGTSKAGKTYQIDYAKMTDMHSEAALIQHLADREGKIWFVKGTSLYFVKADSATLGSYAVNYVPPTTQSFASGNFLRLRGVKNLTLSKQTKVNVRSWNHKQKKAVTSTKSLSGTGDTPVVYDYRLPNLSQEQADKIATQRLDENTRHELSVEVEMPGDPTLDPRMQLVLSGTGTIFDQAYAIDSIDHEISFDSGYRMTVRTKGRNKKRSTS